MGCGQRVRKGQRWRGESVSWIQGLLLKYRVARRESTNPNDCFGEEVSTKIIWEMHCRRHIDQPGRLSFQANLIQKTGLACFE